jgi:integrase
MATIRKRGSSYYLNWREGGTQYRRSLGQIERGQAEALRAKKEAELKGLIPKAHGRTVRMVLDDYETWAKKARPDSYKGIRHALRLISDKMGDHGAESIDPGVIEQWATNHHLAPSTVHKSLRLARAAYRREIRLRKVRENPFVHVELPKLVVSRAPPWYTHEDLRALYEAPRGHIWRFMVNTGLRRGEMAKAVRADIRNNILQIESTPTGRTKSGKWRWVPLNKAAQDALALLGKDRLVECHKDTLDDWFSEDRSAVNKGRQKAIKGTPHWLRHTFCTHLAQAGVSLHEIQRLAGHSSITMTEKYAHHLPDAGRSAIDKLDL